MGGEINRSQVQIEHPFTVFLAGFVDLPRREPTGKANEEVHSTPAFDDARDKALNGGSLGEIGFSAPQPFPCRAGATQQRRPIFIGGIGHRHARAVCSQIKGDGAAQGAGSARYDGDSTLKVHRDTSHSIDSRGTQMIAEGAEAGG